MNAPGLIEQHRFGWFMMAASLLQGDAEAARIVFASCIVTRAHHDWQQDQFKIYAISPQFDPLPQRCVAPQYVWVMTKHEPLGQITARAQRLTAPPTIPVDLSMLTRKP